jgi:hypothetical protein
MPSHDDLIVADCEVLLHVLLLRDESVDRNSRSPWTDTSFCEPGQSTWLTICGASGSLMS